MKTVKDYVSEAASPAFQARTRSLARARTNSSFSIKFFTEIPLRLSSVAMAFTLIFLMAAASALYMLSASLSIACIRRDVSSSSTYEGTKGGLVGAGGQWRENEIYLSAHCFPCQAAASASTSSRRISVKLDVTVSEVLTGEDPTRLDRRADLLSGILLHLPTCSVEGSAGLPCCGQWNDNSNLENKSRATHINPTIAFIPIFSWDRPKWC